MIDIHTHILPHVDDGARDSRESRSMVEIAADNGTTGIVLTPHCNVPGLYDNTDKKKLLEKMDVLRQKVDNEALGVNLYSGAEIYLDERALRLFAEDRLLSINNTRYYLVEFDFNFTGKYMSDMLYEVTKYGIPIVAHPERYGAVKENSDWAKTWVDFGCLLQINKSSIKGSFGDSAKRSAWELMDEDLVSFIASDAHRADRRTTNMSDEKVEVDMEYGRDYGDKIFCENPQNMINNVDLRR